MFSIKMIGDWYGPLQWCLSKEHEDEDGLSSGFNSEDLKMMHFFYPLGEREDASSVDGSISTHAMNE